MWAQHQCTASWAGVAARRSRLQLPLFPLQLADLRTDFLLPLAVAATQVATQTVQTNLDFPQSVSLAETEPAARFSRLSLRLGPTGVHLRNRVHAGSRADLR